MQPPLFFGNFLPTSMKQVSARYKNKKLAAVEGWLISYWLCSFNSVSDCWKKKNKKCSSPFYQVCNLYILQTDHTIVPWSPFAELDTLDILKITLYPQNHSISSKSLLLHQEFRRKLRKIWRMMFCKILHIFDSPKKLNFGIDGWWSMQFQQLKTNYTCSRSAQRRKTSPLWFTRYSWL